MLLCRCDYKTDIYMTRISTLKIHSFRNLSAVEIAPSPKLNVFFGKNGAGKTTVLESISVLAHSRSFRTHKTQHLVQYNESAFTLFGEIISTQGSNNIGIQRSKNAKNIVKINGRTAKTAGELAMVLPLKVVDSHSFDLLEGSASSRRKVLDWLVFHVEPKFKLAWQAYSQCIKQRNSLLKDENTRREDLVVWDRQLSALAIEIDGYRQQTLDVLADKFRELVDQTEIAVNSQVVKLTYTAGWRIPTAPIPREAEVDVKTAANLLFNELSNCFARDKQLKRTTIGPHRSDFQVMIGKVQAVELLSRGQQKSIITALHIAQAHVLKECVGTIPVFLLDDMMSELDPINAQSLFKWLQQLDSQLFVTGVTVPTNFVESFNEHASEIEHTRGDIKVFHVEHGEVTVTCADDY